MGRKTSGFFNEELKVAHLLISFFLPAIAFYFQKIQENFIYIFLLLHIF